MLQVSLKQSQGIRLDVDFSCQNGEILALVGPSGAGKSTVLRAIAGLYSPQVGRIISSGKIWLDSDDGINLTPQQRRVGMVFQSYALFPHLTVTDNIRLALDPSQRTDDLSVNKLLAQVNLTGLD